jgi:hypothetical protein
VIAVGAIVALTLFAVACGGDDDDDETATPTPSGEATPVGESVTPTRTPQGTPVTTAGGTSGAAECSDADEQRGLLSKVELSGEDGIYSQGEEIEITQTLVNCTTDDTDLFYTTTQRYKVTVEEAETAVVVWDSADGKAFEETPFDDVLAPLETRIYTETWDQTNRDGEQVEAGTYKVSFFNVGCGVEDQSDCQFGSIKQLIIE